MRNAKPPMWEGHWSSAGDWGEAANGITGDPTDIWGVPWDQHVLPILPGEKEAVSMPRINRGPAAAR